MITAACFSIACGGGSAQRPGPVEAPARRSTESAEVRPLLVDAGAASICDKLEGAFLEIDEPNAPEGPERGQAEKIGRLWARKCHAHRAGDQLTVELGGEGWSWVASEKEQLGARFEVSQYLPFRFDFRLVSTLDYDYARRDGVFSIWVTPVKNIDANVVPLREPNVKRKGAWSHLLGAVSTVFTLESVEARAEDTAGERGGKRFESRLAHGVTITIDTCTGQVDKLMTPLENATVPQRPYDLPTHRWEANARVRLRPGGLDADGPWEAPEGAFKVKIDVEEGDAVRARLLCEPDAERIIDAYLQGGREPTVEALSEQRGKQIELVTESDDRCPMVLITTPAKANATSKYRYVAYSEADKVKPVAACPTEPR